MGIKISELPQASQLTSDDVIPIVQNGDTKKIPVGNVISNSHNSSTAGTYSSNYINGVTTPENSYNTSNNKHYSCDYINNTVKNANNSGTTNTYSCNYINGIIESGSNTNGSYVKYIDGTMICYATISTTTEGVTSYYNTLSRTGNISVTFPETFIDVPNVTITPHGNQSIGSQILTTVPMTASAFTFWLIKTQNSTSTVCQFSYIAIGRWK